MSLGFAIPVCPISGRRAVVETCLKMPLVVQTNKKCVLSSKSAYNAQDLLFQTHTQTQGIQLQRSDSLVDERQAVHEC